MAVLLMVRSIEAIDEVQLAVLDAIEQDMSAVLLDHVSHAKSEYRSRFTARERPSTHTTPACVIWTSRTSGPSTTCIPFPRPHCREGASEGHVRKNVVAVASVPTTEAMMV